LHCGHLVARHESEPGSEPDSVATTSKTSPVLWWPLHPCEVRSCATRPPTTQEDFPNDPLGSGSCGKATMMWQLCRRPHHLFFGFKGDKKTLGCASILGSARWNDGRGRCCSCTPPLRAKASSLDVQEKVWKGSAPPSHTVHPREGARCHLAIARYSGLGHLLAFPGQPAVAPQGHPARVEQGRMQGSVPSLVTPSSLSCDTCFCPPNTH